MISEDREGRAVLAVHVQPGAARAGVVGRHGDALKIRVAAPAEGGRANRAAQVLLARAFGVPTNAVELVSGAASRQKRFRFASLTPEQLGARLNTALSPRQ